MVVFWQCDTRTEALEREEFLIRWFGSLYDNSGILTNIKYHGSQSYQGVSSFSSVEQKKHVDNWIASKQNASQYAKKIGVDSKTLIYWGVKFYNKINLPIQYQSKDITQTQINQILDEYEKVFLIKSKTDFAKQNNINRSRIRDWVIKYRPHLNSKIQEIEIQREKEIYKNYIKRDIKNTTIKDFLKENKTSSTKLNKILKKFKEEIFI